MKKKKLIILASVILTLIVIFAVDIIIEKQRLEKSYSQLAYIRWSGEKKGKGYGQQSIFIDRAEKFNEEDIEAMRNKINKKLSEDSLLSDGGSSRAWIDAYSSKENVELRKDTNTVTVDAYLVGGDFFLIHPIKLKNGNYPQEGCPQILLDENVAWNLFGSSDIEGKKVWIKDTVYTVSGVVIYDESEEERAALGNSDTVYIPYSAYSSDGKCVTCYETVMPEPIKNYGYNILAEAAEIEVLSDGEKQALRSPLFFGGRELIENSRRYSPLRLLLKAKDRKYIDMKTQSIAYPYWENMARYEEGRYVRLIYIMSTILLIGILSGITTFSVRVFYKKAGH
ncbi:MAG: ABC transporter permease [Eubacterium sp.]|nr:ABC transporter permease [Eubacterium sp.]